MEFNIVIASDLNYGIGIYNNNEYKLPWTNKTDMKFFTNLTKTTKNPLKQNGIIMGHNTFKSIGKPLPNRINIVLSNNKNLEIDNVIVKNNFNDCLNIANIETLFLIGGASLINQYINHPKLKYIYFNHIQNKYDCNIIIAPILDLKYIKILKSEEVDNIIMYKLENELYKNEYDYLHLLNKIFKDGNKRQTRNSVTLSLFGKSLKFNLKNQLPVLTTKRVFLRGIIEELIWFLNGKTNSKILEDKKINIWKQNTSKDFLAKMNLYYSEGDIGPMYGFNWCHYGANYNGYDKDYTNMGFNQLNYVLELLKNDPFSRRILITTFDPANANKGVLYPCHGIVTQFYTDEKDSIRYLSCVMHQRSADMFLGVPFNITSYSLLCYIICEILNNTTEYTYKPDELIINFGDCHIYTDHIEAIHTQIIREPRQFPTLEFKKKITNFSDLNYHDINILNYVYHPTIKANMVA